MTAAVWIKVRDDAREVRQQAAAAALQGLAAELKAAFIDPPPAQDSAVTVMAAIEAAPAQSGETPCPECSGRFQWIKNVNNGHVHGQCEAGCLTIM